MQLSWLLQQRFDGEGNILSIVIYIYLLYLVVCKARWASQKSFLVSTKKKIKCLSQVMTVFGEQLWDSIFVTEIKSNKLGNGATLLHSRCWEFFGMCWELIMPLTTFTNVFPKKIYLVFYRLLSSRNCLNVICLLKQREGNSCLLVFVL